MKLNLPDVTNSNSVSVINSNFAAIEQELQNKVLYRDNPPGEPNTLSTELDANGQEIYNVGNLRTTNLYINGDRVIPESLVVIDGDDISDALLKVANLSDLVSPAIARTNLGLGNVNNTSDVNKPVSLPTASALSAKQDTLVSGVNIKTINGFPVIGSGDLSISGGGGGSFVQAGTGAVTRTVQDKVRELFSVKDFGAVGDGIVDDTAACQLALNQAGVAGGCVYFPPGDYKITGGGLTIPQENITVYGEGKSSRVFSSGTIFTYPLGVYVGGHVVVQDIKDLMIEQTGDGTSINMTQTWDTLGKAGPTVSGCYFYSSSLTTTAATAILMRGIWSANVTNCWFIGRGLGGGPTTGIGGFGIRTTHTNNIDSSVMNVVIANNTFITIAFPMHFGPRTDLNGGRVEGIKITGNNCAAGWQAITTHSSLAVSVVGNQLSDYQVAMLCSGDFDMNITGNGEITGSLSGINLMPNAMGLCERIAITGNNISGAGGVGVRLSNVTTADWVRNITVTGNSFRGIPGSMVGYGIALEGSQAINGCNFGGNTFQWLSSALWFNSASHARNAIGQNTVSNSTAYITNLNFSGANGTPLIAGGYSGALVQAGSDLTSAAPTINFPIPFKAGTTPAVFFSIYGTANTTMEMPAVSAISNTSFQVQKKQLSGGSIVLTNYQIVWYAFGEAA